MSKLKTTNPDLLLIWDELQDIFLDFRKLTQRDIDRLNKLGLKTTYEGKHPKIYIVRHGVTHSVTFCSTPSDKYAGRQILRHIRSVYERY